jgi:hypothetical protein
MEQTISFVGTVLAGSEKVLVSRVLGYPFKITNCNDNFSLNQNRLVEVRFFLSYDKEAPTSGLPGGNNLLQFVSNQPYCVGDDDTKEFPINIISEDWPTWLKIHATNNDGSDHDIDCQITIDIIPKEEN